MSEYSVTTNNRFALSVDEDEDLYELLAKQQEDKKRKEEQAAEAAKKAAANKAKTTKKGPAKPADKRNVIKPANDTKPQQTQSNRPYSRNDENRPPRFNRQNREGGDSQNFEKPPQSDNFGSRGRRGGFSARGGRGGPRGGFGGRQPKREFERHSGSDKTGVKAVEKREGFGPHNWGDEIEAQLEQPEQQNDTINEQETTETADVVGETETPVEPQPKEMTLDEWKASQTQSKKTEFKVRRANEGVDTKQWKGTVALQKKKKGDQASDEEEEDEYEDDDEPEVADTKAALEKLNIQITFSDSNRSAPRSRGGRGRGGGGGGFSGSRGSRPGSRGGRGGFSDRKSDGGRSGYVPRVDNENDFPLLGSR